jgi:hypothetical protein
VIFIVVDAVAAGLKHASSTDNIRPAERESIGGVMRGINVGEQEVLS